jgi:hypothetical protein
MKTKLLLLFLVSASFAKAQISIQESFEGGATPTNWTNNGFGYFNNSGFATTGNYSTFASITIGSDRTLTTNSQISTGLAINVSVQARKNAGPAGALGLYYLLAGSSTLNPIQIEYFGTQFIAYHLISGTIPAGTIPSGTSVKFVIRALGSAGTSGEAYFDDFSAVQAATLGTSENNGKSTEITTYPNPASDFVIVESKEKLNSVEIFTMEGRKVLTSKDSKIDTSSLESGVYLMKILDAKNNLITKKLIIK